MSEGKFIVIEGIDGSGITTQVESLRIWFEQQRLPVFVTKEPTRSLLGGVINEALDHGLQFSPDVMALLFTADRRDHLDKKILPELGKGRNVICDRYVLSGLAYQGLQSELDWLRELNRHCRVPDVTVFLDVPVDLSMWRSRSDVWRSAEQVQLFEDKATLERVREQFLTVIEILRNEGQRIEIVDATQGVAVVKERIVDLLAPVLRASETPAANASRSAADISSMLHNDR